MNQGFSAASCISHQSPRFVWISDALLADTVSRFCHHKRYGSSVPGPLEAQRRATKRKNTSLAHYGEGITSVDPSVVLGKTAKINWWQTPANVERERSRQPSGHDFAFSRTDPPGGSRLLPSWLFSEPDQAGQHTRTTDFGVGRNKGSRGSTRRSRRGHEEGRVAQCQSLAEIQDLLTEHGINPRKNKELGQAISRHILGFSVPDIEAYLCDPAFHPPGTSFHLQMLPCLLSRKWGFQSWHAIRDSFCKAAELGLVGIMDLRAIVMQVADAGPMTLVKEDGRIQIVKSAEKERFIYRILMSLSNSRVIELDDLGHEFLSGLMRKMGRSRRLTSTSQQILWKLSRWASARDAPVISRLIILYLRTKCRDETGEETGQKLAERLATIDTSVLQLALLQTTEELVRLAQEDRTSTYVYLFYHWTGTLALLGSRSGILEFSHDLWASHSSSTGSLSAEQRFLALAWTFLALGKRQRASPALSKRLAFLELFETTLERIPQLATREFLDRAILAIRNTALPNRHILLHHLSRLGDGTPVVAGTHPVGLSDVDGFHGQTFSLFLHHDLYQHARLNYTDVLAELAESLNQDLSLFKALSRRMIFKNPRSFEIISRLLENNISLKIALSQAFIPLQNDATQQFLVPNQTRTMENTHSSASKRNPQDGTRRSSLTQERQPKGSSSSPLSAPDSTSDFVAAYPSPHEALDLVNHLAVSFATSPVTSARAALRRVYWCYTFLHRYGGPVRPTVTRALWHVGVTRYGDSGTSRTLLQWILSLIRRTEGEDVARHLLWSQSLREQWRREIEELAAAKDDQKAHCTEKDEKQQQRLLPVEGLGELSTDTTIETTTESKKDLDTASREGGLSWAAAGITAGGGAGDDTSILAASLDTLRKIRFVKTEPPELPFFFEKSTRRADWEAMTQAMDQCNTQSEGRGGSPLVSRDQPEQSR
ncbi:hypothetical protein ABEF94_013447 [Exophiala dermatitidis]